MLVNVAMYMYAKYPYEEPLPVAEVRSARAKPLDYITNTGVAAASSGAASSSSSSSSSSAASSAGPSLLQLLSKPKDATDKV